MSKSHVTRISLSHINIKSAQPYQNIRRTLTGGACIERSVLQGSSTAVLVYRVYHTKGKIGKDALNMQSTSRRGVPYKGEINIQYVQGDNALRQKKGHENRP